MLLACWGTFSRSFCTTRYRRASLLNLKYEDPMTESERPPVNSEIGHFGNILPVRYCLGVLVPFGFEVGGALGAKAEGFLAECVRVAEWKNQGVGDLAFWQGLG